MIRSYPSYGFESELLCRHHFVYDTGRHRSALEASSWETFLVALFAAGLDEAFGEKGTARHYDRRNAIFLRRPHTLREMKVHQYRNVYPSRFQWPISFRNGFIPRPHHLVGRRCHFLSTTRRGRNVHKTPKAYFSSRLAYFSSFLFITTIVITIITVILSPFFAAEFSQLEQCNADRVCSSISRTKYERRHFCWKDFRAMSMAAPTASYTARAWSERT